MCELGAISNITSNYSAFGHYHSFDSRGLVRTHLF